MDRNRDLTGAAAKPQPGASPGHVHRGLTQVDMGVSIATGGPGAVRAVALSWCFGARTGSDAAPVRRRASRSRAWGQTDSVWVVSVSTMARMAPMVWNVALRNMLSGTSISKASSIASITVTVACEVSPTP